MPRATLVAIDRNGWSRCVGISGRDRRNAQSSYLDPEAWLWDDYPLLPSANVVYRAGEGGIPLAAFDILLPVKNGMPYLKHSIESIRQQTSADWRLLILEHGSTDGSAELADKFAEADKRIVVHSFPDAKGLASLLNHGIALCDCRYIARQDSDDLSIPNRLEAMSDFMASNSDLVLATSDMIGISPSGKLISYLSSPKSAEEIRAAVFFYNPVYHPTVVIDFPSLVRLGARYGEVFLDLSLEKKLSISLEKKLSILGPAQDYLLFGQLVLAGNCRNVGAPFVEYRIHDRSVSAMKRLEQTREALKISRFLAETFCDICGVATFDPSPFCSHGEFVFDCGQDDYTGFYEVMESSLRLGLGESTALNRELAFRWTLARRSFSRVVGRFAYFTSRYGARPAEYRLVRNMLLRSIRSRYVYKVEKNV